MIKSEHKNIQRLYIRDNELYQGKDIVISDNHLHYLKNVMRKNEGDPLRVFNGHDGEWLCLIKELNKKNGLLSISNKLIEQKSAPDLWVLASPVKKEAFEWMIEKSSELGAAEFIPVLCQHTVVHRVNEERAQLIATEAAEQSERLDILKIQTPCTLQDLLKKWDKQRKIIFCVERESAVPIAEALSHIPRSQPLAVLIGPEGGFSKQEVLELQKLEYVLPVSLGPRILRAETALTAALACLQAQCGDWV